MGGETRLCTQHPRRSAGRVSPPCVSRGYVVPRILSSLSRARHAPGPEKRSPSATRLCVLSSLMASLTGNSHISSPTTPSLRHHESLSPQTNKKQKRERREQFSSRAVRAHVPSRRHKGNGRGPRFLSAQGAAHEDHGTTSLCEAASRGPAGARGTGAPHDGKHTRTHV